MAEDINNNRKTRTERHDERLRQEKNEARSRLVKLIKAGVILLVVFTILAGGTAWWHYKTFPGYVEKDYIHAVDKGTDYLYLEWNATRNTDDYKLFYRLADSTTDKEIKPDIDESWKEISARKNNCQIKDLNEGTTYFVVIRADNARHKGRETNISEFTTRKSQQINIDEDLVKFTTSKPFKPDVGASTEISIRSSDKKVADVDPSTGEIVITGPGTTEISIEATETTEYAGAKKTVALKVFDAKETKADGAKPRTIELLSADNCEVIKTLNGEDGYKVPQGMAYTGDKYYICFCKNYSQSCIIRFEVEGEGKEVIIPDIPLGHANGFTYDPYTNRFYNVRGHSQLCVVYDMNGNSYNMISMPSESTGIAYDIVRMKIYTSSIDSLVACEPDSLEVISEFKRIKRSGKEYVQDCEAYNGLMMHCVSGENLKGTNYIDIYDMDNAVYLGTFVCELGEVESCIVDQEGYLVILTNNSGTDEFIWNTGINMKQFAEAYSDIQEE